MVGYVALDLNWGRCSRKWGDRSLQGGEGMVVCGVVDPYWGRC